jgi:hypothetical protein
MKSIYILLFLLLTSCVSHRGTLFIDKYSPQQNQSENEVRIHIGILSPSLFDKSIRYLEKQYSKPIQLVGVGGSVYSFKEYADKMGVKMPTMMDSFTIINNDILSNMEYKDVWLSKGPPKAVFVIDEFVTWRYKDDSMVIFFEGKTVTEVE